MKKLKKLSKRLDSHEQRVRREKIAQRSSIRAAIVPEVACTYKPSLWTRLLRVFLIRRSH